MADPRPLLYGLEELRAQLDRSNAVLDNLEQRLEEVLGKSQNDNDGMPAQMAETITSGKAWAVMVSKAISLELQVVSWLNKKLMPHSALEALPAEVAALKDAPFEIVYGGKPSDLLIPTDPGVLKMHVENYGEGRKTFGTQCMGPAYMYSLLASYIVHTSVFVLSALVFILSKCDNQSATATYPYVLLVPVAFTALATRFLEVQALKYYVLPHVLRTKCLSLPVIGPVSYWKWACYTGMMTCLGVTSQHTTGFAVAQSLKGYGFCNAQPLEETWSEMMNRSVFGLLCINWKFWNPAILLLIIWLLGLYPVWRAWLQSVTFPWITSGKFFFIRTWISEYPDDIHHLDESEEKGILNYAPQLVMDKHHHKKEVRWRSLAYKLNFEGWWTNFSQGLYTNAKVCNWASIAGMIFPVEVAKAKDALEKGNQHKHVANIYTNHAYEIQKRMLARTVGFVFLRGVLVIHLKINIFDLQLENSGHDELTSSEVQILGSILISIGLLCLTELTNNKAVLTTIQCLRGAQEDVQKKRTLLADRKIEDPERFKKKDLSEGEQISLILVERYDRAWSDTYKVTFWTLLCALLLIYAVIRIYLAASE